MKFYDFLPAPSPRRVRIFIAEKGLWDRIDHVQVDLRGGAHFRPEFDRINPFRTVPALELDDGTCISESIACCRYLEAAFPEPALMGRTPKEQAVIAMWEHRCEWDGFIGGAEMLRNTAPGMKDRGLTGPLAFEQIPALADRGRKRIAWFHEFLEKRLAESEYIGGDSYSVADITALISIDFAGRQKAGIPETHTHLKRWYDLVAARPSAKL